jgi:hypothetical protein
MMIEKDTNGNFVCKICYVPHTNLQLALNCVDSHKLTNIPAIPEKNEENPYNSELIKSYQADVSREGTTKAAERLMLSLIEDYVISRDRDMKEKGRVGALTLNLGKLASEAVNNYNKILYGSKSTSVSMSVDASKKSDVDALKDILTGREGKTVNGDSKSIQ